MRQLRDYQEQAKNDLTAAYTSGHRRASLVLPCGTGKTVVASHLIPDTPRARTVIFVPTIALLHQTWLCLADDHPGAALLGVCAATAIDPDDLSPDRAAALGTPLTTDVDTIAGHLDAAPEPLIIVATYASSPAVAAATTQSSTTIGLLICDEAHRTAGLTDKAWAAPVHTIAARQRLFMTATPRTITVADTTDTDLDTAEVISMSSLTDYGPHIAPIGFREAISAGHLSDYQIAIIGVNQRHAWNQLTVSATKTGHRASRAGTQLALLSGVATHDLRSVLVFHNRIADSQSWTEELHHVAASRGITLNAAHIDGSTPDDQRRAILDQLTNPGQTLTVVSNCKVFAEGIDVPALDAVMFAAPRTAGPDIVQIVGRAIRPHPHRRHQKALIILPVLDHADDPADIDTKTARTNYLAAWQVLTALAEEDELLHDSLARWRDHIEHDAPPPDTDRIQIDTTALSTTGHAFVLKTIARASSPHLLTATRLSAFHARYGHTRPKPHTELDGYQIADRLTAARAAYRAGRLHPRVAAHFEAIPGFTWTTRTPATRRTPNEWIALVDRFIQQTGVHTITRADWITDPETRTRANVGEWVHTHARRNGYLTNDERQALTATGLHST